MPSGPGKSVCVRVCGGGEESERERHREIRQRERIEAREDQRMETKELRERERCFVWFKAIVSFRFFC